MIYLITYYRQILLKTLGATVSGYSTVMLDNPAKDAINKKYQDFT